VPDDAIRKFQSEENINMFTKCSAKDITGIDSVLDNIIKASQDFKKKQGCKI
ncbi:MAG: hypothetical protein MHPSP_002622, partial [Paramarteilia canceri]